MRMQDTGFLPSALLGAALLFGGTASAGTMVGTESFLTPGDLTVIDSGGELLEFLDLMPTLGMSVDEALDEYDDDDFR